MLPTTSGTSIHTCMNFDFEHSWLSLVHFLSILPFVHVAGCSFTANHQNQRGFIDHREVVHLASLFVYIIDCIIYNLLHHLNVEFCRVGMKRHLCPLLPPFVKPKAFPPSPGVISAPHKHPCTCSSSSSECWEEKVGPVLCHFSFSSFKLWH